MLLVGHFIVYSEEGEIGYKIFISENKEIVNGVHVLFNGIVPSYSECYYQKIKKLKIEVGEEESTVESFAYIQGICYTDDENYLELRMLKIHPSLRLV